MDRSERQNALDAGGPGAAERLFPLVYDELRKLAARKLAEERPGQTLQATALVHEAYLRLIGDDATFEGRGHFFAAAAEAMRRILVEAARRRNSQKRGGGRKNEGLDPDRLAAPGPREDLVALDEALTRLAEKDPEAAELVKLRYFAGLALPEAAQALGVSPRTASRLWSYARAWLRREVEGDEGEAPG
jgi:RNA polymerase sigma factor (TIGR02999 family)